MKKKEEEEGKLNFFLSVWDLGLGTWRKKRTRNLAKMEDFSDNF